VSTTLAPDFDVQVTKAADDLNSVPDDTVVYTVTLTNTGPSTAPGVILTDVLPTGLTLVSATLDGQTGAEAGGIITFPAINMSSGQVATATLTFTVDTATDGVVTNTASVQDLSSAGENDINNNSASSDITVVAEADLNVTQIVSSVASQVGASLTYEITVSNAGPSPATSVIIADSLPIGVSFVSGTGPGGEILTEVGGVVTGNVASLASGASADMTVIVSIDAGAPSSVVNSVTVSSSTGDSNSANDTAIATTTVDPKNSSISGSVYIDANNNGIKEPSEGPIAGVQLTLEGTDLVGVISTQVVITDANGDYSFTGLAQGTYAVTEAQPEPYRDGMVTVGIGATATVGENMFTQIVLGESTDATEFNFGELFQLLSKRWFLSTS